jgi:group I intron endonuclease
MYVGSSTNIKTRIRKHIESLKRNAHHSKYLQRVFNRYGQDSIEVRTLVICETKNLQVYEQALIDGLSPAFNGTKSANSPVQRGQKLPETWKNNAAEAVRRRYANGFKVNHPPRSEKYRCVVSQESTLRWQDDTKREKNISAIRAAMTEEECQKRSERTKKLWDDPEYRAKAVAARKGNAYSKGYKCTPEQIENRRKAARISHTKRKHGDLWKKFYIQYYPNYAGDIDA